MKDKKEFVLKPLTKKRKEIEKPVKRKPKTTECRECSRLITIKKDGVHCRKIILEHGCITQLEVIRRFTNHCEDFTY